LAHNEVANISEWQASEGGAFVLHWTGALGPDATGMAVGLRVLKNATKNKAPIPNVKMVMTGFI
jgi:hypothetical protein